MKKVLSVCLVLIMVFAACPFGGMLSVNAEVPTKLSISNTNISPVIDGVVDESYGDMQWDQKATDLKVPEKNLFPRTQAELDTMIEAYNVMRMKGWLTYDNEGIYMAVEATDLSASTDYNSVQPWKSTNIQVVMYVEASRYFFTLSYGGNNKAVLANDTMRSELDESEVTEYTVKETVLSNSVRLCWEIKIPYEALWDISGITQDTDIRLGVIQTSMAKGYCCQAFGNAFDLQYDTLLPVKVNYTPVKTGDCNWTVEGTTLTLSGNGNMANYSYDSPAPWWGKNITKVIIGNGVKTIGENAFLGCENIETVNFRGTPEEWEEVTVLSGNDALENAKLYYKYTDDSLNNLSISNIVTSPVIDGVVDKAYGDFAWNQSAKNLEVGDNNLYPRTEGDCEVFEEVFDLMNMKGWLAYGNDGIYMAVEATDLSAHAPVSSTQPWHSTNIQVVMYIDSSRYFFTLYYDEEGEAILYNDATRSELDISQVTEYTVKETALENGVKLCWEIKIPYEALYDVSGIDQYTDIRLGVIQTSMAKGYCCQAFGNAFDLRYDTLLPVSVNYLPSEILSMGILTVPLKKYYAVGEALDVTGGMLVLVCDDGSYYITDITDDMVSGFDSSEAGVKILTVEYKGISTNFSVTVLDTNPDVNGDGYLNIIDLIYLRGKIMSSDVLNDLTFDVNCDGKVDARDIVNMKKRLAEMQ